jgi:hypothetical protein
MSAERRPLSEDNVYFAFPDGQLAYDCVSCNATCCRGYGYALGRPSELQAVLHARPNMHLFIAPPEHAPRGTYAMVKNCPPECFFLTKQGMCGIQAEHGYAAKPETCRLFPFNHFCRVGDQLVVAPHPGLCPLQVTPFGTVSEQSRHALLLEELQQRGIGGPIPVVRIDPEVSTDEILRLERTIRQRAERLEETADYVQFAHTQWTLSLALPALPAYVRNEAERERSRHDLPEFFERACRTLEVTLPQAAMHGSSLSRVMAAATPQLRTQILFHAGASEPAEPTYSALMRLPHMLLALFVFARAAQCAGMNEVTLQTLLHLLKSNAPLLRLISGLHRVFVWKPGIVLPSAFAGGPAFQAPYFRIAKALLDRTQRRRMRTLADILEESCTLQGIDRIRFLTLLSGVLAGAVVSLPESKFVRPRWWRRVRCTVQRAGLAVASEEQLSSIAIKQQVT